MKKRIFASLLAMVMAFSLLPLNALAKPSGKTDWTADIYAVIVGADNKITSVNTLTSKGYNGTTKDFTGQGFEWQWKSNENGYTISTTITGSDRNVNASPYMKYPTNLWDYPDKTFKFEGYTTRAYNPVVSDSVSGLKLSGKDSYSWQWERNNGVGKNSYSAALALKSKLSVWYVFQDTTPAVTYKDPQVNCHILYIDDSINPLGYRTSPWQKKSFPCALHGANCPDSVGSHSISVASVKAAAQELLAANVLVAGYELVGWTKKAGYSPDIKSFDASGNIILSTKTNDDIYFVAKKPQSQLTDWDKLTVTKTASPSGTVKPGDEITYTITVTNSTGKDLTDVKVTDKLPDQLTFNSAATPESQYDPTTGVWTIPSLAAGKVATLTIKTTVKAGAAAGTISNTATITGAKSDNDELDGNGNTGTSEDVSVEEPTLPDLSITKTTDAEDVKVGDSFDYTITVKNTGAGNATNVVVKDTLPNGLEYVSYDTNYPNKQDWEFNQNGQELTWTFKEIPAGASATITLTVKAVTATPEGDGGYTNKAYIAGEENNPGTAPAVPVGNALTLTKTANVQKVNVGEIFSYTLNVKNVSESDATDVVVEDVLPDGLAFYAESVRGQSGTYQFDQDAQNPQALKWTFGTLPAGEEVTITLRVKAISAGTVENRASIVGGTEVKSDAVSIVTPDKGTLTIVKKVNHKLDEDAKFTFTLKRYTLSANPSGSEALYTEDRTFSHEPIVVHVAKGSNTGSAKVNLPDFPVSTVYTVEEENPTSKLKMEGTTGAFTKAEYEGKMSCPDISQEIVTSNSFSTLWPGQEITSVTITCTNTYELTPLAKFPVTVKNSYAYASSTGAGDYAADETVAIHAGSRSNYKFNGWTSDSTDVTFANANKASTTFTMPNHAVTVTASWTYTDSSHDDDDDEDTYYFAVKKVDAQDDHALNGAKFGLYLDDKQVATATSNRSGIAMFRVNESDYRKINAKSDLYYQELTAPEGYVVNSDEVSIERSNLTTSWSKAEKDAETVWNYRGTTPDLLNGDDHFAYVVGYQDGCVHPNALITRAETATIFFRLLKDSVRDGNLLTSNTFADVPNAYWANTAISTMAGLGIVQGYNSTAFDPNASITRAEFAAICARFDTGKSSGTQTFTDIKGHWAEKYIERAAELGWIKGLEDGTFRPNDCITRAQAMTMINRVLNRIPEENGDLLSSMNVWPDCNPGDWFYLAVQEATNSHDYKHKAGNYETWISMKQDPDWTRYEN